MNTIERLEKWKNGHKGRAVNIEIDNGYGASCWSVKLHLSNNKAIEAYEVSFWEHDPSDVPPEIVFVENGDDGDWPGLEKTINAAIDRAELLGHK